MINWQILYAPCFMGPPGPLKGTSTSSGLQTNGARSCFSLGRVLIRLNGARLYNAVRTVHTGGPADRRMRIRGTVTAGAHHCRLQGLFDVEALKSQVPGLQVRMQDNVTEVFHYDAAADVLITSRVWICATVSR